MELVYEIEACVTRAALVLQDSLLEALPGFRTINFQAGTLKEITETLGEIGAGDRRNEKMPIVCLLTPFDKSKTGGGDLILTKFTLFIACATEANLKRYQRQTKTFEPVLAPIANEVRKQIINAGFCYSYEVDARYREIEHDYWAKNQQKSIFNEYVDAIELRDFTINISPSYCS